VTADDTVVEEGRLELAVPPGESAAATVPFQAPRPKPGVEHRLEVSLVLPRATAWAPAVAASATEPASVRMLPSPPPGL